MRRRDIVRLGLLGGGCLSISARVRAQKLPIRIGVLVPVPDNGGGFLWPLSGTGTSAPMRIGAAAREHVR